MDEPSLMNTMVVDEQFYYGNESLPNIAAPIMPPEHQLPPINKVINRVDDQSSIHNEEAPSNQRHSKWTDEENELFAKAVELYGYGRWVAISKFIRTRNPLQCKNHGRRRKPTGQKKIDSPSETSVAMASHPHSQLTDPPNQAPLQLNESNVDSTNITSSNTGNNNTSPEPDVISAIITDVNDISEEEKTANINWFMGKPAKTPERYLRIRNHLITAWNHVKPYYLTKTAGRLNLVNGGDVNAVGLIHSYLEEVGIINTNCNEEYRRDRNQPKVPKENDAKRRKKTKKTPGYYWVDVIDNEAEVDKANDIKNIVQEGKTRPKRAVKKRYSENKNDIEFNNDPFTLIPVGFYNHPRSAPFTVEISGAALIVMEFHSHLAYTEIIGLLGGRFITNEDGARYLKVEYVFPCRSTSTGIQCEMDPTSEMAARDIFEQKGLDVVGWYHSHPTFEPQPSIRDIENQTSYQGLFRDEASGNEPFIGIIVTPYNSEGTGDTSQIQCIHISKRWNSNNSYRLPFACIQKIIPAERISSEVYEIFYNLLMDYKSYEHKIDMKMAFKNGTRLDKLMSSMRSHVYMSMVDTENFLYEVKRMVEIHYMGEEDAKSLDLNEEAMISRSKEPVDKVIHSLNVQNGGV
ncbi:hypothetical protein BDB01DRAFT_776507 [Pilobolus umbonatus]|nr:hypothetical protein BDB01DRAFT_776507 [Pilobolus umbonatus]